MHKSFTIMYRISAAQHRYKWRRSNHEWFGMVLIRVTVQAVLRLYSVLVSLVRWRFGYGYGINGGYTPTNQTQDKQVKKVRAWRRWFCKWQR